MEFAKMSIAIKNDDLKLKDIMWHHTSHDAF